MKTVEVEIGGRVALLTINNPPVNTLSMQTMEDLHWALSVVENDPQVKAVVVRGAGKHFMAGAELNEFAAIDTRDEAARVSALGHSLMDRIESFGKPVIVAISGACLGGGLELALACHIRIAAEDAIFGLPEITLGIIPGAGGTQRLPRAIGLSRALEWILTGERFDARVAEQWGLVSKVCPRETVVEESLDLACRIARHGMVAIRGALAAVMAGARGLAHTGARTETENFARCFETMDKREGIAAFFEKRSPRFQDR